MARKVTRTPWRKVTLECAIEESAMQVLVHKSRRDGTRVHGFEERPVVRVIFRTPGGRTFSGPRISKPLRRELERLR